jgi:hypothetical protein
MPYYKPCRKYEADPGNNGEPGPAVWDCYNHPTHKICEICKQIPGLSERYFFCTCCGATVHLDCTAVMEHCNRRTFLPQVTQLPSIRIK